MKTRKQRIPAMLLAVLMLGMTACASDEQEETGIPPEISSSETEETVAEETVEPDYLVKYEGTDFEAATYTFDVNSQDVYPNYIGDEETGEPVNDAQYRRDTWIKENYNIDLKYNKAGDTVATVRAAVMANDQSVDCVINDMANVHSALTKNALVRDLKTIPGFELDAAWWSQGMNREFTINDKLFTTTGPMVFAYYYTPRLVAFNLQLVEDYGMESPYSVVNEGRWTLEYMQASMESVKTDLDGDGKYGDDDMWGASVDEYSAAGFYISAGGTQIAYDADGKPYFTLGDETNYMILEVVASIIGNEQYTQKAEALASRSGAYDIRDKVYTFKNGHALYMGYGSQAIAIYLRDMENDYGILPVPKLDETQAEYINFGSAFSPAFVGLPLNNNRDDINGILLNTLGYISQRDVQPLVSEVLLKGKAARDEESQKMIDLIYADVYLDLNSCYNFGNSFTLIRDFTMGKTQDFASGWKRIEKAAGKALEQFFESIADAEANNP